MSKSTLNRRHSTTEIQQASICRCTNKATKEVFYLVKSDSQEGVWYQVSFDHSRLAWSCTCPATKPCKHERAVQEVLKIRRARIASQMGGDTPAVVAVMQAAEDCKLVHAERVQCAKVSPRLQEDWSTPHGPLYREVRKTLTEAEETAASYYRMSLQEF